MSFLNPAASKTGAPQRYQLFGSSIFLCRPLSARLEKPNQRIDSLLSFAFFFSFFGGKVIFLLLSPLWPSDIHPLPQYTGVVESG